MSSFNFLYYYHTDHLGSVRLVTTAESSSWAGDNNGQIFERIDYLPFGKIFRDKQYWYGDSALKKYCRDCRGQGEQFVKGPYGCGTL